MDSTDSNLFSPNGDIQFSGTFKNGKPWSGIGKIYDQTNSNLHEGSISNGTPSGPNIKIYNSHNLTTYIGSMLSGLKTGHGILYKDFSSNQILYTGAWQNDTYHGQGTIYYDKTDNKKYVGSFIDGRYHGYGELYW